MSQPQTSTPTRRPVLGPVDDLRVVEMGQLLAGPFCGQLFADFGAEVIKIEQPGQGDPMRQWGRSKSGEPPLWWPVVARNKKSVTLNLRSGEGQDLLKALLRQADVVIENFRPGTLERWNLGYEVMRELNPRLVLIRVTGFGQDGPYASRAGYGVIGEAMGGLRYVTGDPSAPPSRVGISIGDSLAGTFAALGGMFAIHARERTGTGQVVDSAIYEAVLAMMESLLPEYQFADFVRERTGAILPKISPSNVYPTGDGDILLIAANMDTVFRRLAAAMARPELADDARFATHTARGEHQAELDTIIAEWTSEHSIDELSKILNEAGVPAGRVYRAPEMLEDPQFAARKSIVQVYHPELGPMWMQNVAPHLSETPGGIRWTGPKLGEHNPEVYRDLLGLSDEQVQALAADGVI